MTDLDIAHPPGRRTSSLGVDVDVASDGHGFLPDRGGLAASEIAKQIAQIVRGSLLLLAVEALQ